MISWLRHSPPLLYMDDMRTAWKKENLVNYLQAICLLGKTRIPQSERSLLAHSYMWSPGTPADTVMYSSTAVFYLHYSRRKAYDNTARNFKTFPHIKEKQP